MTLVKESEARQIGRSVGSEARQIGRSVGSDLSLNENSVIVITLLKWPGYGYFSIRVRRD